MKDDRKVHGLLDPLASNLAFVDEMYARFRADPASVGAEWRGLFERELPPPAMGPLPPPSLPTRTGSEEALLWCRVQGLVWAYRAHGHVEADLDPLGEAERGPHPDLALSAHGLTQADLGREVPAFGLVPSRQTVPLKDLIARLREVYCGVIGIEYMHISDPVRRGFLRACVEERSNPFREDREAQLHIYELLVAAEVLEHFIHTKYVGTKRFSLEGGETLLPLLHLALEQAGRYGVHEAVLGMAHRGRLNVLANLLCKRASVIFAEFEDIAPETAQGGGDVKYHLGYSADHITRAGDRIHLSLAFNPSHLEAVDPVVIGRVRAKQRRAKDLGHERVLGVLVHGDAAFAGQGLVAETLNLSNLHGYRTGGTLHVIVNNQIGFTTSPKASRSTRHCTDSAKMIEAPIFHVNCYDPEAVAHVVKIAMEYRQHFHTDVIIDMVCFRRYGHNEADEPSFTQPLLYEKISTKPPIYKSYGEDLIARGVLDRKEYEAIIRNRRDALERDLLAARSQVERPNIQAGTGYWQGFRGGLDRDVPDVETAVGRDILSGLAARVTRLPEGFSAHPKIVRLLAQRAAMGRGEQPLDWGMAETLAFASLLREGRLVRLSGQDSRRGTFSHRHAVVVDTRTGEEYTPLCHLGEGLGEFRIYDSMLSEAAVLGFEYGYSLDYPDGLVIWEAQFGDFVNGAQVILDQFISSAEDKWRRLSGLTLFLPHGFEGQGPEHSSARFERFLTLCAKDNMQIVYPTTPAQLFHVLRRQVLRPLRKPLVLLTPKSLLRHPACTSSLVDLSEGSFARVLLDRSLPADSVRRILLCTGKIYYDLLEERARLGSEDTALVRLEQLYPLREEELGAALRHYRNAVELCWVQEEPANMGAQGFIVPRLQPLLGGLRLRTVSRVESPSPATGSHKVHVLEQRQLVLEAFHVDGAAQPAGDVNTQRGPSRRSPGDRQKNHGLDGGGRME